jgi:hypothetical protein
MDHDSWTGGGGGGIKCYLRGGGATEKNDASQPNTRSICKNSLGMMTVTVTVTM